mgnify:CR=1 FL=1
MAATIAPCFGTDKNRTKSDHRLGSESSRGEAATWRTTAVAVVFKNGSGYVRVERDGVVIHEHRFEAE